MKKAKFWEEYKSYSSLPWYKRLLFAAEQWYYTRIRQKGE